MTYLWRLDATEQARLIRTGAVSSVELTKATLARVSAVNPKINAIVDLMADEALKAAAEADRKTHAGEHTGLLHGVPVTIKINVDYAGRANTNGVVAFKDNICKEDNPVVSNLKKSGAVIIGRTNTPAFSMRWFTDNALHGRTLNPWNKEITPGGSSGGASASLITGMGAVGHGNDIGVVLVRADDLLPLQHMVDGGNAIPNLGGALRTTGAWGTQGRADDDARSIGGLSFERGFLGRDRHAGRRQTGRGGLRSRHRLRVAALRAID